MKPKFRDKYSFWIVLPVIVGGFYALLTGNAKVGSAVLAYTALLGIDIVVVGIETYKKAKASLSWNTVHGEIIDLEKEKQNTNKNAAKYSLKIKYRYFVNGIKYVNDRYSLYGGISSSSESRIDQIKNNYLESANYLKVFYNPDIPEESLIRPGLHWINFIGIVAGIAMFFVCGISALDLLGLTDLII